MDFRITRGSGLAGTWPLFYEGNFWKMWPEWNEEGDCLSATLKSLWQSSQPLPAS